MANIFRTVTVKFYQNRPDFVDDVAKTFGVFVGFAVPVAVHLQNATLSFTIESINTIQVSWRTFKLLYRKFIQDNVYKRLSESTAFCGRYGKTFWCVFSVHNVD